MIDIISIPNVMDMELKSGYDMIDISYSIYHNPVFNVFVIMVYLKAIYIMNIHIHIPDMI